MTLKTSDERIKELEDALNKLRVTICRNATDTLWMDEPKGSLAHVTAVDFISMELGDDWDYDAFLQEEAAKLKEEAATLQALYTSVGEP